MWAGVGTHGEDIDVMLGRGGRSCHTGASSPPCQRPCHRRLAAGSLASERLIAHATVQGVAEPESLLHAVRECMVVLGQSGDQRASLAGLSSGSTSSLVSE